ncbi:TPA: hypothetical protein N0F65_001330 [Lagenidium giganteum]|uniref:Uncharacterized protein n=1 Tax=Lagenidium giganteum TaxID=4803 RepID=A0AAV2Z231_9STRA|nr:TPA: hypothetical protein N0F65_001330 [Lagenidium giganteum]
MQARLSISATNGHALATAAATDKDRFSPRRKPDVLRDTYKPPEDRLVDAYAECAELDRELKIIEHAGHARMGIFAKPLLDASIKKNTNQPAEALSVQVVEEECSDPFYQRFYDEQGRSMFELLLRARMRILALAKLIHGHKSVPFILAEIELAEAYARINLWKQGHVHIANAIEVLRCVDAGRMEEESTAQMANGNISKGPNKQRVAGAKDGLLFLRVLEYFYQLQADHESRGQLECSVFASEVEEWKEQDRKQLYSNFDPADGVVMVFQTKHIEDLFDAAGTPTMHWQQFLIQLEQNNPLFKQYVRSVEALLPQITLNALKSTFAALDTSRDGLVSLHALIVRIQGLVDHDIYFKTLSEKLQALSDRVTSQFVSWSEILEHGRDRRLFHDDAQELRPRLKLFMGRYYLKKGQLEDAVRQTQLAIAEAESVFGTETAVLVEYYLVIAEALSVRFKQQSVMAQQTALDTAERWLQSVEGSRGLRSKAIQLIDEECDRSGTILTKKEAEERARESMLREYAALSVVKPDIAMMDDAIEYCTKAWSLQESSCGREHITTAVIHVTLAQIYLIKAEPMETIRYFNKAIEIFENSCNGPVPASAYLRLEIAKVYHQQQDHANARQVYMEVGDFFHSFAQEFLGCDATRRDVCVLAVEAWKYWLQLSAHATLEEQRQVQRKIHQATIDGFGEFAVETADSARDLGLFLQKMGQLKPAEKYLKLACYIIESHFGTNDRRYRKLKKSVMDVIGQQKNAFSPEDGDDGHAWLML